jgi:hypothetical protein
MRRIILSVLALVSFIAPLSAEVVVFEDSFNGNTLDSSKWNTLFPFSDSTVSVGGGAVNLVARGTIATKTSFTTPYTLTGSFINQNNTAHSAYSVFLLNFRSSGNIISGDIYKNLDGFMISFWPRSTVGGSDGLFLSIANPASPFGETKTTNLASRGFFPTTGQEHFFALTDSGDGFTFDIDGVRVFDYTSSLSFGDKIGFASRETMQFPGSDYTGDVKVNGVQVTSSVPEPSSLSLLALGGVVVMAGRQRLV